MRPLVVSLSTTFVVISVLGCCCCVPGANKDASQPGKVPAPIAAKTKGATTKDAANNPGGNKEPGDDHAQKAYDAEVARMKADHQKAMAKFTADKKAVDDALSRYVAAKAEFEAATKLQEARKHYDASKANADEDVGKLQMKFAHSRFHAIIKDYPDTQAAKDAKLLLDGKDVAALKVPAAPIIPTAAKLVEPQLTLPPSPQEVAAAKAQAEIDRKAKAAADAQAEIERKAREEYDVKGLVLLLPTLSGKADNFGGEITGTVVNNRGKMLSYAEVRFNLYDESGAQIGSALANINNLEAGGRWNFKAIAFKKFHTYKVIKLSGF